MSEWLGGEHGSAVELRRLSKRYGEVRALIDVSLSVEPGRFLVLLGPSGSGKSTLIRCLAGIERPTEGSISIAGVAVAGPDRHTPPERRDLAMVFQDFALWPHMTVQENVRFALRRRKPGRAASHELASTMLDRVGLAQKRDRYPYELSGGEQQRVALARALVGRPRLLLFDEPLSSLDASLREHLRIEIGTLVRESGASAVYITHDQGEAFALGDEVGVLQAGRLIQIGTPEAIYRTPAAAFVARFTGLAGTFAGRLLGPVRPLPGSGSPSQPRLQSDASSPLDFEDALRSGPGSARLPGEGGRRLAVQVALPSDQLGRQLTIAATAMSEMAPGTAVQVLVRPTGARICSPDDPDATLTGMVRDVAFCGRGYEYVVEIGSDLALTGVFDGRRLSRGHRCGIALDAQGCLVFPDEAAAPGPAPLPSAALPSSAKRGAAAQEGLDPQPVGRRP